jgi:putative Holliday junction resolvase
MTDLTVMAFDYGMRRIGVAVGNTMTKLGQPVKTISEANSDVRFKVIEALISEWQPSRLVVGLPCHPDGTEHEMSQKARRFGNQLQGRFSLPIAWVDERYTSAVLENDPKFQQKQASKQTFSLDSESARLILEQYFMERAAA